MYEEARLIIQAPVLLLVESGDSLGRRLLEDWLPRPKRWLRRARALQPGALQPAYLIFVKDFESAWQFLEKAGGHQQLKPPQPGHLCVVVIALEGVSFCYLDLQD